MCDHHTTMGVTSIDGSGGPTLVIDCRHTSGTVIRLWGKISPMAPDSPELTWKVWRFRTKDQAKPSVTVPFWTVPRERNGTVPLSATFFVLVPCLRSRLPRDITRNWRTNHFGLWPLPKLALGRRVIADHRGTLYRVKCLSDVPFSIGHRPQSAHRRSAQKPEPGLTTLGAWKSHWSVVMSELAPNSSIVPRAKGARQLRVERRQA